LIRIAAQRGSTLSALVVAADGARAPLQPLASALRVLALQAFDAGGQAPPARDDPTTASETGSGSGPGSGSGTGS
jgi:predicted DNA-binding ribbon-helix-helix protein